MATKAIQARIVIESQEQLEHLWRTHRIFNESLPFLITHIFKMKRGELGKNYKDIYDSIMEKRNPAQDSFGKLEPITQTKPPRKLGSGKNKGEWVEKALEINRSEKILFDRNKPPLAFSSEFWRKLCEMSIQLIHGHMELTENWKTEHKAWIEEKTEWEGKHPEYIKVRPIFESFENEVKGRITKKRRRWHLYLEFLKNHPELAGWRGKETVINSISGEGLKRIKRARPNKKNDIEAEEFFKANPELDALDKLHKYYETNFVRSWVRRKNPDGFYHRPTFTLPSPIIHPAWYQFKKGATYKNLDIEQGIVSLRVVTSENGKGRKGEWRAFHFISDPRLKMFKKIKATKKNRKGEVVEADKYIFKDPQLGLDREAEIKGIKLIFKDIKIDEKENFKSGTPYLMFTCDIPDLPSRIPVKQDTCDWYSEKKAIRKLREKIEKSLDGKPFVTCAIDLGIRHLGTATVRENGKIVRTRILWNEAQKYLLDGNVVKAGGPTLHHIAFHKLELRKGRSLRGKPIKGERSFVELQNHTTNMGEDRFKKGARKIVRFTLGLDRKKEEPKTDILLIENLKEALLPDAEREKGINKALINWSKGNLIKWIRYLAEDAGIRVVEVPGYYSSQACSRCGSLGIRYSFQKDPESGGIEPIFGPVEKLFGCPKEGCLLDVNADYNASVNLHKIFFDEFPKVNKLKAEKYRVNNTEFDIKDIKEKVLNRIQKIHKKDFDIDF